MGEDVAMTLAELPAGTKKTITLDDVKILLIRTEDSPDGEPSLFAVEAECPHAKAPLEKGAVCNGRLVCPWHTGTFDLATGTLLETPPLRDLKRYPVRVLDGEIRVDSVPIPPQAPPIDVGEAKHMVFAGAGAATAAALGILQHAGFAGKVTVVDPVTDEPIDRTQLTKNALSGKKKLSELGLFATNGAADGDPLSRLTIERKQGQVNSLNNAQHTLELDTGEQITYDALLLATGSFPKRPKIPGADLEHVFVIRHTADLKRMEPLLRPGCRVALVGDSFIAFEAASALRQRGLSTTILARSQRPFEQKFGSAIAAGLLALYRRHGVVVNTGTEVTAITPVAVVTGNGAETPADVVVLAVGVEPVTQYAPVLARARRGGFAVGRDLRLLPPVWCAGDIASVEGTRIAHWRLAEQHGRAAARQMLAYVTAGEHGSSAPSEGVPLFWTTHFEYRLNYAGHADYWNELKIVGDPDTLECLAFYVRDGMVAAVLGSKRDTAVAALMEHLRQPLSLERALQITAPM